jgi:hypothetical protein
MLTFYCSTKLLSLLELLIGLKRIAVLVFNLYVDWQLVCEWLLRALLTKLSL